MSNDIIAWDDHGLDVLQFMHVRRKLQPLVLIILTFTRLVVVVSSPPSVVVVSSVPPQAVTPKDTNNADK